MSLKNAALSSSAAACAALLVLAGCAAPQAQPCTPVVVSECSWVKQLGPLSARAADTPDTKREIIALYDAIQANCK